MIDLHTHILPSVDDGPADIEESIRIVRDGMEDGVSAFVLTPHVKDEGDWERLDLIRQAFISLKDECAARGIGARLIIGAEFLLTPSLPERLKKNSTLTINGAGRHVLIELPFHQFPIYAEDRVFQLLLDGFIPVIAHPERYTYLNKKWDVFKKWAESGVMFQVNTGSLNGKYGIIVKWRAKSLLKNGLVNFLGSDIHSSKDKRCSFRDALKVVRHVKSDNGIILTAEEFSKYY